jgi:steroid 5-alpha reductase family enzyme
MSKFNGLTISNLKLKQYKINVHVTNQIHPKLTMKPHLVHYFTLQRIHVFILIISSSPVILSQAKAYNQFHITSDFKIVIPIFSVIQNANTYVRQNIGPAMLMEYILTKR